MCSTDAASIIIMQNILKIKYTKYASNFNLKLLSFIFHFI